jgi:glycerol-3-phosphate O-acyltransferase
MQPAETHEIAPSPHQPNRVLAWLYKRLFSHIGVDASWSADVQDAAQRGVVVHVMRTISILDFLCLDFLLRRFALPLVHFVNDLGLGILEPFGKGERRLRFRRQIPEGEAIRTAIEGGHSALLFLRRRPRFGETGREKSKPPSDLIRELVTLQRTFDRPILLVPNVFIWTETPPNAKRGLTDLFFGPVEWPGRIRRSLQFLFNYQNAQIRSGAPFDLERFVSEHADKTDAEIADRVSFALLRRIERERAIVIGPSKKTPGRLKEELLRSPRVRRHVEGEARASGRSIAKVERQAAKIIDKLAARQTPYVIRWFSSFLTWFWHKIYDGVVIDQEGLERVRAAAREGAVIYLPSHKSHIDYLVLSYVLYKNSLVPPLIAAGENLSFFPAGPILRRGGAFFIRRSFKGQKIYPALVDAYMRKLLVEGYGIEFFLEGGRSRSGKLLPPKFGLLSMVVDAALLLHEKRVSFVPISIGYERIIEEQSYVRELSGEEKQKENVGGLLKTTTILRSRYGRLYVQFGDVMSFDELVQEARLEHGLDRHGTEALTPSARRTLVQRIAHRVTYEINAVTVVTPAALVATALFSHRRRGMRRSDLEAMCVRILAKLEREGARIASTISDAPGTVRREMLDEALELFLDAKLIQRHEAGEETIYSILDERRLALEYYKNNLIHFFVPSALVSAALLVGGRSSISERTLRARVQELSRAFKYEFMYRVDATFDEIFDEALATLLKEGAIVEQEGRISVAPGPEGSMLEIYAEMLGSYFESYLLAIRASALLLEEPMTKKEWFKRALQLGQRMYLSGEIANREALSQLKLEPALKSLRDHSLVKFEPGEKLSPGPAITTRDDLYEYEAKLTAFLRT